MKYHSVVKATFLARPNRFIAHVELEGRQVVAHVKNTGRCRELLVPGYTVYLEPARSPGRKTPYSLVAVDKNGLLINMDSQAPNKAVEEALRAGWLPPGINGPAANIRREVTWGNSRFDFCWEAGGKTVLAEVKGVTLEEDGRVLFPDAPTLRGVKHLEELVRAKRAGLEAQVIFVVQLAGAKAFSPNDKTHPAFGNALRDAARAGVGISAWGCAVTPGSIVLGEQIPVELAPQLR